MIITGKNRNGFSVANLQELYTDNSSAFFSIFELFDAHLFETTFDFSKLEECVHWDQWRRAALRIQTYPNESHRIKALDELLRTFEVYGMSFRKEFKEKLFVVQKQNLRPPMQIGLMVQRCTNPPHDLSQYLFQLLHA